MQKNKNIASPSTTQYHDTPNSKTHFIKFRVTEIEKMELEHTAKLLNLSLSTLIRRALHNVKIEKKNYRCEQCRRNSDRRFHFACPVQQDGQQPQPACKAL